MDTDNLDLDDILDSALEDLDDKAPPVVPASEEPVVTAEKSAAPVPDPSRDFTADSDPFPVPSPEELDRMLKDFPLQEFEEAMKNEGEDADPQLMQQFMGMFSQLAQKHQPTQDEEKVSEPSEPVVPQSGIENNINQTLQLLQQGTESMKKQADAQGGENPLAALLKDLEGEEDGDLLKKVFADLQNSDMEDPDALGQALNSMLSGVMSKDVLFDPIKSLADEYPTWLTQNKEHAEYQKYEEQYHCMKRVLVGLQEQDKPQSGEGGTQDSVMELLAEMHKFGPPPDDLLKKVVPAEEWDTLFGAQTNESNEAATKEWQELQKLLGDVGTGASSGSEPPKPEDCCIM